MHGSRLRRIFRNVDSRTDRQNQLGRVASIQRQFQDSLRFHSLADTNGSGLHKRRVGLNLDLLGTLTHFERHVNDRIAVYLQHDSGLYERPEAGQSCFQFVRTQRQVRQNIHAGFVADGASSDSCFDLRCCDFNARQHCTARILHGAADLRR